MVPTRTASQQASLARIAEEDWTELPGLIRGRMPFGPNMVSQALEGVRRAGKDLHATLADIAIPDWRLFSRNEIRDLSQLVTSIYYTNANDSQLPRLVERANTWIATIRSR